jgi:D-xylulose reductase
MPATPLFCAASATACATACGTPGGPVPLDVVAMQVKELSIETIFRYVNIYPRVINIIASGKLNVKSLVTKCYSFADSAAPLSTPQPCRKKT